MCRMETILNARTDGRTRVMFVRLFCCTASQSTAVVMSVRSVHLIPLFHTGHESPELPRIDFLLIRGDS